MSEYPYRQPPPQTEHPYISYEQPLPPNTDGYMEETVRRTAVKGIKHSRAQDPNLFTRPSLFNRFGFAFGVIGMAIGIAALVLSMMSKSTTEAQITHLQQQLASTQESVRADVANGSNSLGQLSSKVGNMGAALNSVLQFNQACSMDFTGPNGPAEYWLPCADQKPAG